MYIAETLINPLFTDVAFRRDSEGDGLVHYESGDVMSPPSLVPSARLPPTNAELILPSIYCNSPDSEVSFNCKLSIIFGF